MSTNDTQATLFEEKKLDTASLKKFAQAARVQLLGIVASKLDRVLAADSLARRESEKAVAELEREIEKESREQVVERVAYTWFNRFCALRFMDVNRYTQLGTVSPAEGFSQPEILADAKQGVIDDDWDVDKTKVLGLLDGTLPSDDPQEEAYQLLLIGVCNNLNAVMPKMFQKIADYTELLIPDDLLSDSSILTATRETLTADTCQDVEVIGWLYQFYISEKKDDVFAALKKGKKITPENIPAATQLFTPHWIVRYLVENSLGRLWMLNHPDSRLMEQMDYYIKPEEPETDFLRISSPEEIKICDPACGSGHMLTYAFDLLYAIYEEQGYPSTDIPRLILTHNLYGIEIDQRAGALAAFALTMKAREKYRRFLTSGKVVQPNICVLENISIDPEDLDAYLAQVGRDLFSGDLQGVVNQWEEADNFGSLIRPVVTDVSEVLELLRMRQMGEDLFLAGVHQKVLTALRQADYLSPKYHVVVANPPYMGARNMDSGLANFLKQKYEPSKADAFGAFIERSRELAIAQGVIAMITIPNWMFLSSFLKLRTIIIDETTVTQLIHNGRGVWGGDFGSCSFVLTNESPKAGQRGVFKRLFVDQGEINSNDVLNERFFDTTNFPDFSPLLSDLKALPGYPIAYWISDEARQSFANNKPLGEIAYPCQGMATTNNELFLRRWSEVSASKTNYAATSEDDAEQSGKKWFPYNKGGAYRKWYGNNDFVVNFENRGQTICDYIDNTPGAKVGSNGRVINRDKYFQPCVTWSFVSSTYFGVRTSPQGFVFDVGGSSAFPPKKMIPFVAGFLCSNAAFELMKALNPTLNFQVGNVAQLPLPDFDGSLGADVSKTVESLIDYGRDDWDSFESSWDFEGSPLLMNKDATLAATYESFSARNQERIADARQLEAQNNSLFLESLGLGSDFSSEVDLKNVTLSINPVYRYDDEKSDSELEALFLADTMREFISYAVGCMLGRYSLDKPGLILANQGDTVDDYRQQIPEPTFAPDEDNVIPLLDGDWFTDDISERFKEFLKVTFGTEHYEENLTFLENSLYPDNLTGKKRKTIRDYFLKGFYNHHIKLYKKRPIYWLFSSPKGTFNALIYMHRYRPDTVSVVLNDYLRDFQTKLKSKSDHLQTVADSGDSSKTEKAKAIKDMNVITKQLNELEDYEREVLYPLATQQVEIDLDDGVRVNYNKFGTALKKVTGLTGKG